MSTTTTNIPATVNNNPELAAIAETWDANQQGSTHFLWNFCRKLVAFNDANPKVTQAEIGAACAVKANKSTPYSKTWVSRRLSAGRGTPEQPTSSAACTAFQELVDGNAGRAKKAKKASSTTAQEAYKAGIAFLRRAEKLGMDTDEIVDGVAEEFASADTSSQSQAA